MGFAGAADRQARLTRRDRALSTGAAADGVVNGSMLMVPVDRKTRIYAQRRIGGTGRCTVKENFPYS
jgi:hypothetical protein